MKVRRVRKKPDFFNIPVIKKDIRKKGFLKLGTQRFSTPSIPVRTIIPHENLLVWGKVKGFGWWPGRIAERAELCGPVDPEDDPTRWIKWFGDHKYTETNIKNIALFQDFTVYFRRGVYKQNKLYHLAVDEALEEAARRSGKHLRSKEKGISWAEHRFHPEGCVGFLPKKVVDSLSDQKMTDSELQQFLTVPEQKKVKRSLDDFIQTRNEAIIHVRQGLLKMSDMCLCCGDQSPKTEHPFFEGALCELCKDGYAELLYFCDGNYCCVCGKSQSVLSCQEQRCGKCFCTLCIEALVGCASSDIEAQKTPWKCYLCREESNHGLLHRRDHWEQTWQNFVNNPDSFRESEFWQNISDESLVKKPIKVLSLFDGLSAGLVALKELKFVIEEYYAVEIDHNAIQISHANHPEIRHVGDVRMVNNKELLEWGPFDLLIGGSPCNDLAVVNPVRKGLWSDKSTGSLFFEYIRILNTLKLMAVVDKRPFFWLFENVMKMDKCTKVMMSRYFEQNPTVLDARLVSPASRPRHYWGNIPGMNRPLITSTSHKLTLQECLESGRNSSTSKIGTITTNAQTVHYRTRRRVSSIDDALYDHKDILWSAEIEKVFGFPAHYTDHGNLSCTRRLSLMGKSWSIPVIKHVISPLKKFFLVEESNES